eukprot:TRINITY_DN42239_c0_g1_i1.p1 TRINITY_DN42239_c0_g1~~TRINITY_DN42239_c0_g1_i1.p1  ORF type:complete len:114 (+),score=3.80 TRINITY_DN42239_c0_g1_i1:267-608(+)
MRLRISFSWRSRCDWVTKERSGSMLSSMFVYPISVILSKFTRSGIALGKVFKPYLSKSDVRKKSLSLKLDSFNVGYAERSIPCIPSVSYTHLRAHETPEHLVCRLLLEKKKNR